MINKGIITMQRCPSCLADTLERVGCEYYCGQCKDIQLMIADQVRMVPSKYESNSKSKRELETERRLNALIRQFTDKHRDISADEMAIFRQRLSAIKGATPRKKGSRQAAAVVAFVGLAGEIKLTIREFCQQNCLSVRLFNQKYKVYQKLFRPPCPADDESEQMKLEEKQEESSPTEKSEALPLPTPPLEGARHALSLIFDDVFSKFIFQSRRAEITESLLRRLQGIDGDLLRRIRYGENSPLKLYYLIFAVLKALKHKINYLQFSQIIERKTGYLMKRKAACEVRKHYDAFLSSKAVKQEGEQESDREGQEEEQEEEALP